MLASGSGPLGALLMIAPLAAIPVFAIVGFPQFPQNAASATVEEEIAPEYESRPATSRSRQKPRSPDDLFAPIDSQTPQASGDHRKTRERDRGSESSQFTGDLRLHGQDPPDSTDPDDAWEVIPDALERVDAPGRRAKPDAQTLPDSFDNPRGSGLTNGRKRGAQQRHDSESSPGVSIDRFNPDLIHPEPPKSTQPGRELPEESRSSVPGARTGERQPERPDSLRRLDEGPAQSPPDAKEQPRWQTAASRLKELGIHKYRLTWNFERQKFLFRCILPSSDGSDVSDLFDADADTPLDAVEAVVRQIDEWLEQGRPAGAAPPN